MDLGFITSVAPLNVLAIVGIFIITTLIALRTGAGKLVGLLLAIVLAPLFIELLPSAFIVGTVRETLPTSFLVIVFSAVLFFLINRMAPDAYNEGGQPMQAILAGVATTIGVIAMWAYQPSLSTLYPLPEFIHTWFAVPYTFWWILAAFFLLGFARRNARWL